MSDVILVLQSAPGFAERLAPHLRALGRPTTEAGIDGSLEGTLASEQPALVVLDFGEGEGPLPQVVRRLRDTLPDCPIIAVAESAGATSGGST